MPSRPPERLESWKQIAGYLRRSVRTVRRWERNEGLPVRRHVHRTLASVFALRSEIDAWCERVAPPAAAPGPVTRTERDANTLSIAVLPFINIGQDAESAYLADGLAAELITTLSRVRALRVTSRTSSAALRGTHKGARAIARQLGVRYLLEGSVQRSGARVRISAQLIDAHDDVNLWVETYAGTLADILSVQEHFTGRVARALELRLSAGDVRRLAERAIPSGPAYDCYLRARYEGWRWRRESIDRSVHLLQQALEIIGDNAQLYAALGLAHLQYREAGIDLTNRPLVEAERCAAKLFALDPFTVSGRQLRGWIRYSRGAPQDAVRDLKEALADDPNNADSLLLLCNCYLISGRVNAGRQIASRLLTIDPLTPITRCMPAFADMLEGKFTAAVAPYRQMLAMDPANPLARLFYFWVLVLAGRRKQARAILAGFPADSQHTVPARVARFFYHAAAGDPARAQEALGSTAEVVAQGSELFPRILAQGFAMAGRHATALRWLRKAIERGFINYPFLAQHDPCLKSLRAEPAYQQLMRTVHERWVNFAE
ncbi:MAG: tetratricopeptide repeat protein [Proteobacteria bacterium]|nr:tetratricopeptide repeat protein [Pseudomonadota bacterium]